MAAILSLIKPFIFNRWTLLAVAVLSAYGVGYMKGCSSERSRIASATTEQAVTESNEAAVVQQEIEVAHDKRVRKILSGDVPDVDAARMLSFWPDQAPPVAAPVP